MADRMAAFEQTEEFGPITDQRERKPEPDVYKKWYRTGSKSGFLSLRSWFEAGKFAVDIGETDNDGLRGNTLVWVDAIELATYLRAVTDGHASRLYPTRKGLPTPESFTYFGGATVEGKPVSRILKVHHWRTGENSYDDRSFVWKTGHFEARKSQSGAFIPDTSNPLSVNMIKLSRIEVAEMSCRTTLALQRFIATDDNPFEALNGERRS